MTINKGKRWSTASAYLRPALKSRPDQAFTKNSVLVHKVIVEGNRAVGVEILDKKKNIEKIYASEEVILSGGAINSPQLLMLSGIIFLNIIWQKLLTIISWMETLERLISFYVWVFFGPWI